MNRQNVGCKVKSRKVYVLRLEHGCYYVGATWRNNVMKRLEEHFMGQGSVWTRMHKPLDFDKQSNPDGPLVELINDADQWDENKYTKKYMELKGIDKVRGGSYCNVSISMGEIALLTQEIQKSNNKCYKCHSADHMMDTCPLVSKSEHERFEFSKKSKIPLLHQNLGVIDIRPNKSREHALARHDAEREKKRLKKTEQ